MCYVYMLNAEKFYLHVEYGRDNGIYRRMFEEVLFTFLLWRNEKLTLYIKINAIKVAKFSSVKRVMKHTKADASTATKINRMRPLHKPIHKRNER